MHSKFEEMFEHAQIHRKLGMLEPSWYLDDDDHFAGSSLTCYLHSIMPRLSQRELKDYPNKAQIVSGYYGYPDWLAFLQETLFDELPDEEREEWHVEFATALFNRKEPINWQKFLHQIHYNILCISKTMAGKFDHLVEDVMALHQKILSHQDVAASDWHAAEDAIIDVTVDPMEIHEFGHKYAEEVALAEHLKSQGISHSVEMSFDEILAYGKIHEMFAANAAAASASWFAMPDEHKGNAIDPLVLLTALAASWITFELSDKEFENDKQRILREKLEDISQDNVLRRVRDIVLNEIRHGS